jgi:hypothetical protein
MLVIPRLNDLDFMVMSTGLNFYVGHDTATNHSAEIFNRMVLLHSTTVTILNTVFERV